MVQFQNILNQFSFIACFQGLLLATALFFMRKGDKQLNRILGSMLLVFSWSGVYYTLDMMGKSAAYAGIWYTNFLSDFSYNPLIYLYVIRLTSGTFKFNKKTILHFVPALLMLIYYFNYYTAGMDEKREILSRGYNYFPWDVAWFSYINLAQGFIYLGISAFVLQKYGHRIKQYYSEIGERNFNWLKFILLFNLFSGILCFFLYKTGWIVFGQTLTIISALMVYVIGYKMISAPPHLPQAESNQPQSENFEMQTVSDMAQVKYERSGLNDERSKQLAEKLQLYMREQKPYLDPELTLKQLADHLQSQPHHLSQVINQQIQKNFYDYINEFRVEEVKSKLSSSKFDHLTLLAIGLDSGFNSKASFNNVFKKYTGKSPSAFKKEMAADMEQAGMV